MTRSFANVQDHWDFVLNESLKLSNSKCGCIYLYDEQTRILSLSSWTGKLNKECQSNVTKRQLLLDEAGIWADAIREHKPLIINNFAQQAHEKKDIPLGRCAIERFLAVPIFDGDKLVALAVYANKPEDYTTDDIQRLTILMTGVWNVIKRLQDEKAMARLLAQRTSMFDNHGAVMLLIDPESGSIIDANPAATIFYGFDRDELLAMKIQDINQLPEAEVKELRERTLHQDQRYFTFPHRLKNGETRFVDVYSSPIPVGGRTLLFSIIFDVTDRELAYKENEYISNHDYLTDLYNRRYFETHFELFNKDDYFPLGIIMGDVNGLKIINDSMGHSFGDLLLISAADLLREFGGKNNIIARVGGDEFAILLLNTNEKELESAVKAMEKKMADIRKDATDEKPVLSIALGYSLQSKDREELNVLMRKAESFLYANKYYDERSLKGKTVNVIMNALFEKSAREKLHSLRVGKISARIAEEMGMGENDINRVKTAGYLHDIGKIGIPEDILNKKERLNKEEWSVMKSHAARSYRILHDSGEFSNLGEIVYSHHEKWDGTGYPRGLKGEQIPLEARIIAVADAYDAMTNNRSYQAKRPQKEAMDELVRCSGTQFDPAIIEVFLKVIKIAISK